MTIPQTSDVYQINATPQKNVVTLPQIPKVDASKSISAKLPPALTQTASTESLSSAALKATSSLSDLTNVASSVESYLKQTITQCTSLMATTPSETKATLLATAKQAASELLEVNTTEQTRLGTINNDLQRRINFATGATALAAKQSLRGDESASRTLTASAKRSFESVINIANSTTYDLAVVEERAIAPRSDFAATLPQTPYKSARS